MSRKIVPLILCGGSGTRLWPASRRQAPKQFIKLLGEHTSFQETVLRVLEPELFAEPVVITSHNYRHMVRDQLEAVGAKASILLEPVQRDSGPAIAAGAAHIARTCPDSLVLALAADHAVRDAEAFRDAIHRAADGAASGCIVTFGVVPDHPETGYGYIKTGTALDRHGLRSVEAFIEKPDLETARRYVEEGYLWNSGNLLFRADRILSEYHRFDPATAVAARRAVKESTIDRGAIVLHPEAFASCRRQSIDRSILERTGCLCVMPVTMGWSDVGSWGAVWQLASKDENGNAGSSQSVFVNARNNLVLSEHLVCVAGLDDVVVIATEDATLVYDRGRSEEIRIIGETLTSASRRELDEHSRVSRPWGAYESLDQGSQYQVRKIVVKPGRHLSPQKHADCTKHWIVVKGTALITIGNEQKVLHEARSIDIPPGEVHRLANPDTIVPVELIEVQMGGHLGETDVAGLDDDVEDRG